MVHVELRCRLLVDLRRLQEANVEHHVFSWARVQWRLCCAFFRGLVDQRSTNLGQNWLKIQVHIWRNLGWIYVVFVLDRQGLLARSLTNIMPTIGCQGWFCLFCVFLANFFEQASFPLCPFGMSILALASLGLFVGILCLCWSHESCSLRTCKNTDSLSNRGPHPGRAKARQSYRCHSPLGMPRWRVVHNVHRQ